MQKLMIFAASFGMLLSLMTALWAAQAQPAEKMMSEEERIIGWKGERVRLLGNGPPYKDTGYKYIGGDGSCISPVNNAKGSLAVEQYAGREGTVVETEAVRHRARVVIELEGKTSERIEARCAFEALGFRSEFERARQLVGKTFWTKGEVELTPPAEYSKLPGRRALIKTHNIEPLTVTRIEWGYYGRPVLLCMTNATGEEGCRLGDSPGDLQYFFDPRFMTVFDAVRYDAGLYAEDPRKRFPTWNADIWKLIESGTVAIGMTEDMAEVACGGMIFLGVESDSSGNLKMKYWCISGPDLVFINGKLAKQASR